MKTSKSTTTLTAQQIRARSGKILGQNLINHHEEPPDSDYAAHHIIPLADGRTKYAREIRKLFDRFFPPETYLHKPLDEWPINQAFNGVWMRNRNYHLLKKKKFHIASFMMKLITRQSMRDSGLLRAETIS